jgi:hypothetical protein
MSIGKRGTASVTNEEGLERGQIEASIEFLQRQLDNGQTIYKIEIETNVPEVVDAY